MTSRSYFSIKTILSLIQNWVSALIITEQQCALDGWGLWPLVAGLAVPSLTDEISTRERWEEREDFILTYYMSSVFSYLSYTCILCVTEDCYCLSSQKNFCEVSTLMFIFFLNMVVILRPFSNFDR